MKSRPRATLHRERIRLISPAQYHYRVTAPRGYQFDDGTHERFEKTHTEAEAAAMRLEPCPEDCDCGAGAPEITIAEERALIEGALTRLSAVFPKADPAWLEAQLREALAGQPATEARIQDILQRRFGLSEGRALAPALLPLQPEGSS